MARDVHSALVSVVEKFLSSREDQSDVSSPGELLQVLKEEGRYLVDTWS